MQVLSMRYCTVTSQSEEMKTFFDSLGISRLPSEVFSEAAEGFSGAIFHAGDSWLEIWQESADMPAGTMLQIVVDDADAFAEFAKSKGLEPQGPMDAHGEHIYFFQAPNGLQLSIQSKISENS